MGCQVKPAPQRRLAHGWTKLYAHHFLMAECADGRKDPGKNEGQAWGGQSQTPRTSSHHGLAARQPQSPPPAKPGQCHHIGYFHIWSEKGHSFSQRDGWKLLLTQPVYNPRSLQRSPDITTDHAPLGKLCPKGAHSEASSTKREKP